MTSPINYILIKDATGGIGLNSLVPTKDGHNLVIISRDLHERQMKAVEFKD